MKILWLTWKDGAHPQAGGAEVINEALATRLVHGGHEVTFIVGGFASGSVHDTRDGYQIIRVGGRLSVYWHAYRYYKKHFAHQTSCTAFVPDLVIDEVNTIPFFAKFYARQRNLLFVHQLAREIWFYEMPFPLSIIGYVLEPLYLWLLRDRTVVTVSESTKADLVRFGFKPEHVHIVSEGIALKPVESLDVINTHKYPNPTVLAFGSMRPMKRTLDVVRAFEIAKKQIPNLELVVAGKAEGAYGALVLDAIQKSRYRSAIRYVGAVDAAAKTELMQKCHVLVVASVKEGWGLVVTEANSQGTPAVVHNVDGLRDSVKNNETGFIAEKNTPAGLAQAIHALLADSSRCATMQHAAWEWSKTITFDKGYKQFLQVIADL